MRKEKLKMRKEKLQMRMNNFLKITQLKTATIIDSNKFNYKNKVVEFVLTLMLTLKTWLIILKIIQLVKQMLKKI